MSAIGRQLVCVPSADEQAGSGDLRFACLEAALLELLDRVEALERALHFEVGQREALETYLLPIAGLPRRVDRLEGEIRARRMGRDAEHRRSGAAK